jgi:hypothetical protein
LKLCGSWAGLSGVTHFHKQPVDSSAFIPTFKTQTEVFAQTEVSTNAKRQMMRMAITLFLTAVFSSTVARGQKITDTTYYQDNIKIVILKISSKEAINTAYYPNGQKKYEGRIGQNIIQKSCVFCRGHRIKECKIGEWYYYDTTGKIIRIEKYKHGRYKKITEWDSSGNKTVVKFKHPLFMSKKIFPI